jgi:hypothetical protein
LYHSFFNVIYIYTKLLYYTYTYCIILSLVNCIILFFDKYTVLCVTHSIVFFLLRSIFWYRVLFCIICDFNISYILHFLLNTWLEMIDLHISRPSESLDGYLQQHPDVESTLASPLVHPSGAIVHASDVYASVALLLDGKTSGGAHDLSKIVDLACVFFYG